MDAYDQCAMSGGSELTTIARWKELVARVSDENMRGNIRTVALVFAELIGDAIVWENQLKGDEMTNSPMVNGWLRASREEAELRLAREMLIDLLQIRFEIAIPSDVITAIEAQPALSMLKVWHRKAIIVPSMEAFIQVLRQ